MTSRKGVGTPKREVVNPSPAPAPAGLEGVVGLNGPLLKKGVIHRKPNLAGDEIFFDALAYAWPVTQAAKMAGYRITSLYDRKLRDPVFARRWAEGIEKGNDFIRSTVRQRAVEGWAEPVYQGGKCVGYVRKFSDRLLELHASARMRDEYGRQTNVNVSGGLSLDVREVPDAKLNATLIALLVKSGLPLDQAQRFAIPELPAPVVEGEFSEAQSDPGSEPGPQPSKGDKNGS